METLERVAVTCAEGVRGDCRGVFKPGGRNRRQVTIMTLADWDAANAELGTAIAWQHRRVNLLVDGLELPRRKGPKLRIGADCVLEITGECDPCKRMEQVAPGLEAALTPDWRGGRLSRVFAEGGIGIGDPIAIEEDR